jgi:hypothetical protein
MIMRMISIDIYFLIILCGGFENGFGKGGGGIYIHNYLGENPIFFKI